jgi:hypothetical protein
MNENFEKEHILLDVNTFAIKDLVLEYTSIKT